MTTCTAKSSTASFTQSLDRNRPLTLVAGNCRTGSLFWRYDDTNETVQVPNIWYNQPVTWRISAVERTANLARASHANRLANPPADMAKGTFYTAGEAWTAALAEDLKRAAELDAMAHEMRLTGKVLC